MTRYIYHLTPNAFEELPGMEEPNDGVHNPMIDGSPECKEVFQDGQEVEEGKEIQIMPYSCNEVNCRCGYSTPVAQHCVSRRDRIVPMLPTDEDEIWNELIAKLAALELFAKVNPTDLDGIENWKRGKIAELKKQYHLTRK